MPVKDSIEITWKIPPTALETTDKPSTNLVLKTAAFEGNFTKLTLFFFVFTEFDQTLQLFIYFVL